MVEIDISRAMKDLRRGFNDFQRHQVPFASALALTRIAQNVAEAETDQLSTVFDNPTPFTKKGVAITPARKSNPTASVFMKDIQSKYLLPFKAGGKQVLGGKRAILAPRGVTLNAYGNLPRSKLNTLKGQPNVFIGRVTSKKGREVSGVWKRVGKGKAEKLKLLIEFEDPKTVTARLDFEGRARAVVDRTYRAEFEAAMAQAMASAR